MGTRSLQIATIAPALTLAIACSRAPHVHDSVSAPAIERIVSSSPPWIDHDKLGSTLWKAERDFYASRGNLPAWIDGDTASPRLTALVDALKHSEDHGLDPARYGTEGFQQATATAEQNKQRYDVEKIPELDTRLTYAYLRYASDLLGWSPTPKAIYANWI